MKRRGLVLTTTILLTACSSSPSEADVQNAIARTDASRPTSPSPDSQAARIPRRATSSKANRFGTSDRSAGETHRKIKTLKVEVQSWTQAILFG